MSIYDELADKVDTLTEDQATDILMWLAKHQPGTLMQALNLAGNVVNDKDKKKEVEKKLREDAKGKDQKVSKDALAKIQKRTGADKRGNGKGGKK